MKLQTLLAMLLVEGVLLVPTLALAQAPDVTADAALKKAREDWTSAEKAAAAAIQAQIQAERSLAKVVAAKAEAPVLAAAQKELGQKSAAVKQAQGKVKIARKTFLAEQAWSARQAVTKTEVSLRLAEQTLASKSAQARTEQGKATAAAKAAAKATAEQAAADKAFQTAPEPKKAEAQKTLEQKTEAAKKAAQAAAQAKEAADKAEAEKTPAQKAVDEQKAALTQAQDNVAVTHAEALGGLKPISRAQWDYAKARHLLFRAGFGGTPEEVERLVQMGPYKAVDYLVDYHNIPQTHLDMDVRGWERPLAYEDLLHTQARDKLAERRMNRDLTQRSNFRRWWLKRLLDTPRPLEEKLVLFWHDHFATSWQEVRDSFMMIQQNQLFRRYADKYDGLLHGIVQDPAMIRYLNNDQNVKGNNNENLGREVLELFSLGEENSANHKKDGYTEKDVREGMTRALTGFTFERWTGQFRFYSKSHDAGSRALLGKKGEFGPHEALDIVLKHPATARYITKKLLEYFVNFEPDPKVVDRLAQVLRDNNYEIRPMLRSLFLSEEFYSPKALANHIKSPAELMVSTAKMMKLANVDPRNIDLACMNMGQTLLEPPSVAGWPEGRFWINAHLILIRYNSASNLVQDGKVDLVALLQGRTFNNPTEVVDHLIQRCLLASLKETKRQALIDFASSLPPSREWPKQREQVNARLRTLVVMLMSTPEFQVS